MIFRRPRLLASVAVSAFVLAALLAGPVHGDDESGTVAEAMRVLKSNCFSCHNDQKKKGGLVMTSRETLLRGGEDGKVLVDGSPDQSAMMESLAADADPHMPPKKQLAAAQIETLNRWIKAGAKWDISALKDPPSALRAVTLAALPASYHPILALALSPDSTRLAVGCGNEVAVFDVSGTGLLAVVRASAHPDAVQSLAWSPDGKRLASGAYRRVVVWAAETLTKEREVTGGLTDRISAMRFLPDGNQLVIADGRVAESGALRVIDSASGAIAASWPAHADTIFDLALSPDGKLLASAGGDRMVKLWNMGAHNEIARFEGHAAQVLALAFDANAAQLVSAGMDQQIKVWDVKTRERINTLGTHAASINAVAWSAAGPAVFAVAEDGSLVRYTELTADSGVANASSSKERKLESADSALYCVAVSSNGERIFAGSHDGRLFCWDKDGKITGKIEVSVIGATASTGK